MKNSLHASDGNFSSSPPPEDLSEIIVDLELSLDINKSMFKDIIHSKKNKLYQSSEESEANLMISSKALDIIALENNRIQEAINRMSCEMAHSETLIGIAVERSKQSRQRRKDLNQKNHLEIKQLKTLVQKREEEIRKLEKYSSSIEEILSKSLKQDTLSPQEVVSEGKKLIHKVTKQLESAKILCDIEEQKCREAEADLKKLQNTVKVGSPLLTKTTDKILNKHYLLNLNYENFWFVGSGGIDDLSDSMRSSASSIEDQQLDDKVIMGSTKKPKLPKLNFPGNSPAKESGQDSPEYKLSRLELAYQIKCEETQSLMRILNDLQAIEWSLNKSLEGGK